MLRNSVRRGGLGQWAVMNLDSIHPSFLPRGYAGRGGQGNEIRGDGERSDGGEDDTGDLNSTQKLIALNEAKAILRDGKG